MNRDTESEFQENRKELLTDWLGLGVHSQQNELTAKRLFSEISHMPTLPLLTAEVREMLKNQHSIGLLLVSVDINEEIEGILGWKVPDQTMQLMGRELAEIKNARLRKSDLLGETIKNGDSFAIVLSPPREKVELEPEDLSRISERVRGLLTQAVEARVSPYLREKFDCYVGCSLFREHPRMPFQRLVSLAVSEAFQDCYEQRFLRKRKKVSLLKSLLRRQGVITVFQPIVDLNSLQTVGYEALVKIPGRELESPERIRNLAGEDDFLLELKRTYLAGALQNAHNLNGCLLFINVEPRMLGEAELRRISRISLQPKEALSPQTIVLELTEQTLVNDFELFKPMVGYFKALGYRVALSRATGTSSSLEIISESLLDYVKIDRWLVKNVEREEIKREIVSTLIKSASRGNCITIADGLETGSELECLKKLGVSWGQGKLLLGDSPKLCIAAPLMSGANSCQ